MQGTTKWFNSVKNFGFITGEDGVDYFVHMSSLPAGIMIKENDEVVFDGSSNEKGPVAINVFKVGD